MPLLIRSEEHTSELQSHDNLVCRLLLEKKKPENTPRHVTARRLHFPPRCPPDVSPRTANLTGPCTTVPSPCPLPLRWTFFFFLMIGPPPAFALFPSTTLFR